MYEKFFESCIKLEYVLFDSLNFYISNQAWNN